jgi:Flp pilus assembly pilin Flp
MLLQQTLGWGSAPMTNSIHKLFRIFRDDEGQDIAEYAVMLAVILVLVVGTIRLVGSNANNAFSAVASSLQWQRALVWILPNEVGGMAVDHETRCKWEDLCAKVEIEKDYDRFVALRILIEGMVKAKEDLLARRRPVKNPSQVPTKFRWQA